MPGENEALTVIAGYLCAKQYGVPYVTMIQTFTDPDGNTSRLAFSAGEEFLRESFNALLLRALPFLRITARRGAALPELAKIPFPFSNIREGQRDFITASYRAIRNGSRLLVSAPTGIGKTMSALYPAVRAIGSGDADKIFCLCAKNVTGKAAADSAALLSTVAAELRSVTIISKEHACPFREVGFSSTRCRRGCTLLSRMGSASYEARRDAALAELLSAERNFTPERIAAVAERYFVCPYELSLDLSEYCDIVVCDYNYVFDFSIRFRRYFEDVKENYVFIVDEAHNLPKRGRDTYSAAFGDTFLYEAEKTVAEEFAGDGEIEGAMKAFRASVEEIRELVLRESEIADGDERFGYYRSSEIPASLANTAAVFSRTLGSKLRARSAVSRQAERLDADMRKFVSVCALFDEHYTFFAESIDSELTVRLVCLDPSVLLDRAMSAAHSTILFSATLSPMDYFSDVCGCEGAATLELDSPYDQGNLLIAAVDSVKTTLAERNYTVEEVAEIILTTVEGREGNYIAYFPSYAYLDKVYRAFIRMADGVTVFKQVQGMKRSQRREFLAEFEKTGDFESRVGFCVLGGMFSEGIDLSGERLIGAIIVGTGMGSITSEQNILKEYYDATRENGMEYAYVYPGFNNVLQAAGRVIRSENDRGVVVLIDDRYADPGIQRLFPPHWDHIRFTADPYSLGELIRRFWDGELS